MGYKFDNSKTMGGTYSNSMSEALNRDANMLFQTFNSEKDNYHELWEKICE